MSGVSWLELQVKASSDAAPYLALTLEQAHLGGWVVLAEEPELHWQFYLPQEPGWEERLGRLEMEIREEGGQLHRQGQVQDEDWAENWKRFYHPLKVGRHLVVCPSWETYQPEPGQLVLILDPGSAFGTGYHWSTRLCMELLEGLDPVEGILDLGTGSGILAISAHLLGGTGLVAVDNDPVAVRVANENLELNRVPCRAELAEGPPPGPFRLITANLVASLLKELAPRLAGALTPGGRLIAGGIIRERRDEVVEALSEAGLILEKERAEEEWVALRLVAPGA